MAPSVTLDGLSVFWDRTLFSYKGAFVVLALRYFLLPSSKARWPIVLALFVVAKSLHRHLSARAFNHGLGPDPVRLRTDIILITGGSNGIGAAFVDIMAKKSDRIVVLDLSEPTYTAGNVRFYKCDVTSPEEIKQVADQIRHELGHPTILINNAGIARGKTILESTAGDIMGVFRVNTLGPFNIMKEFLPHIVKTNHGHIQTVASVASYLAIPNLVDYSVSKAAVLALHETLKVELTSRYNAPNVRTSVICPSKVVTRLGSNLADAPSSFATPTLTPTEVANEMASVILSGTSAHRFLPRSTGFLVPPVRAFPEYFGNFIRKIGGTEGLVDEKNLTQEQKAAMEAYRSAVLTLQGVVD